MDDTALNMRFPVHWSLQGAGNQTIRLNDVTTGFDTLDLTRSPARACGDKTASIRTIVAASAIGTTVKWYGYDFLIYATAVALVLNKLFFPTQDPLIGTLLSIGTVGVGFFARPLGACDKRITGSLAALVDLSNVRLNFLTMCVMARR